MMLKKLTGTSQTKTRPKGSHHLGNLKFRRTTNDSREQKCREVEHSQFVSMTVEVSALHWAAINHLSWADSNQKNVIEFRSSCSNGSRGSNRLKP